MSRIVRFERHENGPRVYVSRVRLHHWYAGAVTMALGAWMLWDDRQDIPSFRKRVALAPVAGFDPVIGVTTSTHGVW